MENSTRDNQEKVRVIAIGDPHFKEKYINISVEFVNIVLKQVEQHEPDFVVVLGDLLDCMGRSYVQTNKLAVHFLKELGKRSKTFLVIGNHDLMNNTQFLTDNHFFTSFHGVEEFTNVYIADKPLFHEVKGKEFVFCPYVYPGRFIEALDTLDTSNTTCSWEMCTAIFAHQEFRGCQMGSIISSEGDIWEDYYPPVISGHIHEMQKVGSNVYYTGSAIQHSFSEEEKKGVWLITFGEKGNDVHFTYEILENTLRSKRSMTVTVEEVDRLLEKGIPNDDHVELRLKVVDDDSSLESFTKLKKEKLKNMGINVLCIPKDSGNKLNHLIEGTKGKYKGNFWENFYLLISKRNNLREKIISKYNL